MNDIKAEKRIQDGINIEDISKHTPLDQIEKTDIVENIGDEIEQELQEEKENIVEDQTNKEQTDKTKTKKGETEEMKRGEVETEEMKNGEVKNGEVETEEMKGEEVETEEVKSEELKSYEMKNEEMKTEEMKTEELKNDEMKNEEMKSEYVKSEDVKIPGETEMESEHDDSGNFDKPKMFISEENEMHKEEQELIIEKNLPSKCDVRDETEIIMPDGINETHKTLMACENDLNVTVGNMEEQLMSEKENILETATNNRKQKELTVPLTENSESDVFVSYPSDTQHLRSNEEIHFYSTEVFEFSDEEIAKKNNVENRNETFVESIRNCTSSNLFEDADALKKELQTESEKRDSNEFEDKDEKEYNMNNKNTYEKTREESGENADLMNTVIEESHPEESNEVNTVCSDDQNVKDPKDFKNDEDKEEETEKEENIVKTNAQTKKLKTEGDVKKDGIKITEIEKMYKHKGRDINKIETVKANSSSNYFSSRNFSNNFEKEKKKKFAQNKVAFPNIKVLINSAKCMKQIGNIDKKEQHKKDIKKKMNQNTSKTTISPRSSKDDIERKCKDAINKKERKTEKKKKNDIKEEGDKQNFNRHDSRYDFPTIKIKPLNFYYHSSSFDKNGKESDEKNTEKNESNNESINGSYNESFSVSNNESINNGSNNESFNVSNNESNKEYNNESNIESNNESNNEFNKKEAKYTTRSFAIREKDSREASGISSVEISPQYFETSDDKESTQEKRIGYMMTLFQNVKKQNMMSRKNINNTSWSAHPQIKKASNKFGINKMPLSKNIGSLHNIAQKTHLNIYDRNSFKKNDFVPMEPFFNRVPNGYYENRKYEYNNFKNYNTSDSTRLPAPKKTRTVGTQTVFTKKVNIGTSTPHFVNFESNNKIALPNFIYIPSVKLPAYNFDAIQVQNGRIIPQKIHHEKTVFQQK